MQNRNDFENIYKVSVNSPYIRCEKYVSVEAQSTKRVQFEYKPIHVERTKEKIGFISNTVEQIWYQLDFEATKPPPSKLPLIRAEIGKEKEHVLTFKNPICGKAIRFNSKWVHADKDEDLWAKIDDASLKVPQEQPKPLNPRKWQIIPSSFEIGPKKSKKIRVVYLPDDIEKQDRIGVRFFSEDLGLFEYECSGKGCPPTESERTLLQSPLGREFTFKLPFKNPFAENVQVFFKLEQNIDDEARFSFKQPSKHQLVVKSFEKVDIEMLFFSEVFGKYECTLVVSIGESLRWVFPIQVETECDMTAAWPVGRVSTRSNQPLQQKLGFFLKELVRSKEAPPDDDESPALDPQSVFNKLARSKIDLHDVENLSVQRASQSRKKSAQLSTLKVPNFEKLSKMKRQSINDPKQSESKFGPVMSLIKEPGDGEQASRRMLAEQMNLGANEISSFMDEFFSILDSDNIDFEISVQEKKYEQLIQKEWLTARFLQTETNNPGEVSFLFDFHPKKPFSSMATFTIILKSGGRWRFRIFLESTEPKYYDSLNIVTSLNLKKGVRFRVYDRDKNGRSAFKAYFKDDSDSGFEVSPLSGHLSPLEKNGTLFTVTFLPLEYGKTKKAKLVIETGSEYYLFLVKGKFQKYNPPKKKNKKKNNVKFT